MGEEAFLPARTLIKCKDALQCIIVTVRIGPGSLKVVDTLKQPLQWQQPPESGHLRNRGNLLRDSANLPAPKPLLTTVEEPFTLPSHFTSEFAGISYSPKGDDAQKLCRTWRIRGMPVIFKWLPAILPAIISVISVLLKILARRNNDTVAIRNDCYIAPSLFLGSLTAAATFQIKVWTDITNGVVNPKLALQLGSRVQVLIFWEFLLIVLLLGIAVHDKFRGWEQREDGFYRSKSALYGHNAAGMVVFWLTFFFTT